MARALAGNQSLAASKATLERAKAHFDAVTGRGLPQIDARARAEYQQINLNTIGLGGMGGGAFPTQPDFDLYTLGAGVTCNLDLFGEPRPIKDAVLAETDPPAEFLRTNMRRRAGGRH